MVGSEEGEEELRVVGLDEKKGERKSGSETAKTDVFEKIETYLPTPQPVSRLEPEGGLVVWVVERAGS